MDENNNNSPEMNTSSSISETTADAYEKVNDAATKPVSAFEMPSDKKSSAATTYYSAPEPTPMSELEKGWDHESKTSPETTMGSTSDSIYTSNTNPTSGPVYTSNVNTAYTSNTTAEAPSAGFAITSLVLGILSIISSCCCIGILFGIPGIIFGCLQQKDQYDQKPGMAVAGIVTSIIGIVFSILVVIYYMCIGYMRNMSNITP